MKDKVASNELPSIRYATFTLNHDVNKRIYQDRT